MAELAKEAIKTLGPVNLNSPVKLAQAMKKAIPGINLTFNDWRRILSEEVTPELTTERKVLERESHKHPVIQTIMDYRKYDKRHGTFIKGVHDKHLVYHHGNALIHPSYLLSVAETYRPASREPNGQNFPTKDFDDPTMSVKNQFVSRFEGGKIIDADLGQVEIRVAAWLSQDKAMIAAINSGEDIHKSMAGILLNKDSADITEEERYECKTRTFLIMYGGGANRLVQELLKSGVRIGKKKAKSMIDDYFDTFSGLKDFIDKVHRDVQRDLKVVSPFGFQRNFVQPEKWASSDGYSIKRKAFNMPIQNTAAVLAYCGMIAVQNALDDRNLQAVMAMQIHDDVILDAPAEEVKEVKEILEHGMVIASLDVARRYGVDFTVPLEVEVLVGDSLGTVAKLED
jgi:DNA polymerase-1